MLGLIWVQSVCKSYEQMTLVGNKLKVLTLCILGNVYAFLCDFIIKIPDKF